MKKNCFEFTEKLVRTYVDEGEVAGVALRVAKGEDTILSVNYGMADVEKNVAVSDETIFRIHSMTKPVTIAIAMMLYEQGLLNLNDFAYEYLPGFKESEVYVKGDNREDITQKAKEPLRIIHLMTMTSGITYESEDVETSTGKKVAMLVKEAYETRTASQSGNLIWFANRIGQIPLCFNPGEHWMYGFSVDVLGAIIEVITGKTLGTVMREMLFDPLCMCDTGFWISSDKLDRLSDLYREENGKLIGGASDVIVRKVTEKPIFEYGGGGLFSTADDYAKFAAMLAQMGTFNGNRYINPRTIDLMRQNHLSEMALKDYRRNRKFHCKGKLQLGYGYGLGVRTLLDPVLERSIVTPGEFGWDGVFGTWFTIDPSQKLSIIYMAQRFPCAHERFIPKLLTSIYAQI